MTLLIIGLILWMGIHFFKRLAPAFRASLDELFGDGLAKGIIAVGLVGSVILMVMGYRAAPIIPIWQPIAGIGHLNNLLMLIAVIMLGMGSSKGVSRTWLRHPMLLGVGVWAVAHLLVNGDQASLVLFGGMIIWVILQIIIVNRAVGPWVRPEAGPISGDIKLIVIGLVMFVVIAGLHVFAGKNPFLGTYG